MGGVIDWHQPAQLRPPDNQGLREFPCRTLSAGDVWWRQHRESVGPWWFSSDVSGRFDLEPPSGTCCLASSASAAIRERVGPDMVARGVVPASLLANRSPSAGYAYPSKFVLPTSTPWRPRNSASAENLRSWCRTRSRALGPPRSRPHVSMASWRICGSAPGDR